ncbi:MAG: protein phosphatase [Deltaproteobacteria bacterium]|nr:protein phosphatase [Deltaproteobacteria bacterium]|tara:strand:+ start:257 stop:868 length:612 start_codon:yes stop_codon:yes gene_type:complete
MSYPIRRPVLFICLLTLSLSGACASNSDTLDGEVAVGQPLESLSAEADVPARFSWVIDNELAALAHPATGQGLAWNIQYLLDANIKTLFTLTLTPLDQSILGSYALKNVHMPVKDFAAPSMEQLQEFVTETEEVVASGGSTAIHCAAGMGRTGTFAAAYLVHKGMPSQEAIDKVRELRPGSIETGVQEDAVHDFQKFLAEPRR